MRRKYNIPTDAGHFVSAEIDSIDFENENLTVKITRNKAETPILFLKKIFQKILIQTKRPNKIRPKKILDKEINEIK